jgi:L-aspartate oxidase
MDIQDLDSRPIVVGSGLAGLMTALYLAPAPVVLLSKGPLGKETSSALAQGGIAASLGADDDVEYHIADTLRAGAGLCDVAAVSRILGAAPQAIADLMRFGVGFDRDAQGRLSLGLEAAHSRKRIVHAGGDASGYEIIRAVTRAVQATPSIHVLEGFSASRLLVTDGAIAGLIADGPHGAVAFTTPKIVLATGGIGGLFQHGTNPSQSFGHGLALAARAGAALTDLEFIQFHPTALDMAGFPLKLISEAVRGEGAILIDETGRRFMSGEPGAELAPRDIVTRAIWRQMTAGHRIYLDARAARDIDFPHRFPSITALCRNAGIDPKGEPIPVRPAAHYHMGGIKVDMEGRSTLPGLWACGEVACTGLHGANRLASNSLLEAVVCAKFVAESLSGHLLPQLHLSADQPFVAGSASDPTPVRSILSQAAGVQRDRAGLSQASTILYPMAISQTPASDPALVGLMILIAALRREESRGGHMRLDFPQHDENSTFPRDLAIGEALEEPAR